MVTADYFTRKSEVAALIISGCILASAAISACPNIDFSIQINNPRGEIEHRIALLHASLATCDTDPRPICPIYQRQLDGLLR